MSDYGVEISLKHGSEPPVYGDFGGNGNCLIKAVHFTTSDVGQKPHLERLLKGVGDFQKRDQIREASVILPPGMGSGRFSGTLDIDWPLTQQEYDQMEYLALWAEPLGAALKGPGSPFE